MFGPMLKAARKDLGWSLLRLGRRLNVSKGYLSGIENEKVRPPSDRKIRRLARLLGRGELVFLRAAWLDRMPLDVRELFVTASQLPKGGQDAVM